MAGNAIDSPVLPQVTRRQPGSCVGGTGHEMRRGWLQFLGYAVVLAVLSLLLPSAQDNYYSKIAMTAGISVTLAVSLNIVNGFTGQFSLGHAGFMAVGAYTAAGISLWIDKADPQLVASTAGQQVVIAAA